MVKDKDIAKALRVQHSGGYYWAVWDHLGCERCPGGCQDADYECFDNLASALRTAREYRAMFEKPSFQNRCWATAKLDVYVIAGPRPDPADEDWSLWDHNGGFTRVEGPWLTDPDRPDWLFIDVADRDGWILSEEECETLKEASLAAIENPRNRAIYRYYVNGGTGSCRACWNPIETHFAADGEWISCQEEM